MKDYESITEADIYCPICGRTIHPENIKEVHQGLHDGFVYVHDNIDHSDSDLQALGTGVQ